MATTDFLIGANHEISSLKECQQIMSCIATRFEYLSAIWDEGVIQLRFGFGMTERMLKHYLRTNLRTKLHVQDISSIVVAAETCARQNTVKAKATKPPMRESVASGTSRSAEIVPVNFCPR